MKKNHMTVSAVLSEEDETARYKLRGNQDAYMEENAQNI